MRWVFWLWSSVLRVRHAEQRGLAIRPRVNGVLPGDAISETRVTISLCLFKLVLSRRNSSRNGDGRSRFQPPELAGHREGNRVFQDGGLHLLRQPAERSSAWRQAGMGRTGRARQHPPAGCCRPGACRSSTRQGPGGLDEVQRPLQANFRRPPRRRMHTSSSGGSKHPRGNRLPPQAAAGGHAPEAAHDDETVSTIGRTSGAASSPSRWRERLEIVAVAAGGDAKTLIPRVDFRQGDEPVCILRSGRHQRPWLLPLNCLSASRYFWRVPADHLVRQRRRRRGFVPPGGQQVVAQVLLVVALLGAAGRVGGFRPEPRGVRGQQLVDQDQLVADQAELELGVGDDDAFGLGKGGALAVNRQGEVADALGQLRGRCAVSASSKSMLMS